MEADIDDDITQLEEVMRQLTEQARAASGRTQRIIFILGVDEQSRKCLAELGVARHRVFADGKKWSRRPRRVKDRQLQ